MSQRSEERPDPNKAMGPPYRIWLFGLLLMAVAAIAYAPAWHGKPVWDDDGHITKPELRSWPGLAQIWVKPGATQQYYPITHSAFWIEHKLWGDSVFPYHLVNILLHGLCAILLLNFLLRLEIPGAWLAAAIFALHPLQVESVAWISELKNTLSGAFFLAAALTYFQFDRRRTEMSYALSLCLFLLGLMSKTAIAPFPVAILVILWWKRGQLSWKRDWVPLVPFFTLGVFTGSFTAWVERNFIGAQGATFNFSLLERCLIAGRAVWFYLFKLAWPAKLTFIYPRWQITHAVWWQYLFPVATLLLLALLWKLRRCSRAPLAALLFFLVMLLPALGFINLYPFAYSFVADHFQYLASIGPVALAAAGVVKLRELLKLGPRFIWASTILICGTLSVLTWRQSASYADIETLWRTTIARNPVSWMAQSNLAGLLLEKGKVDEAIVHFRKAVEIWPGQAEAHNNLANALLQKGSLDEAAVELQKVLELWPNESEAHNNLGGILLQRGEVDEAIAQFRKVLEQDPNHAKAHNNLGNALLQRGEIDEAIVEYEKALQLPFDHAAAHYNIGNAFLRKGAIDEAIAHYEKAVELRPTHVNAQNNLGNALRQKGEAGKAIIHFQKALETDPQSVVALNNLAWVLATASNASLQDGAKAVELAEKAHQFSGEEPIVLHTLAAAYAESGQISRAIETAQRALELATARGNDALAESIRRELAVYQNGKAYRE